MRQRVMWARGPKTGSIISIPAKHAHVLKLTGHVIDVPEEVATPPPRLPEPEKPKRQYRRRDMTAETADLTVQTSIVEASDT